MAGESAREVARRRRASADRLARSAAMFERGAEGEERVASRLADLPPGWAVFHDVRWPGRVRANVDHVVVGPPGIFVVDAKNWSGSVSVVDGVLRQNGRSREQAVAQAAEAALAVAALVPAVDVRLVVPVLCFVGEHTLAGRSRDVLLCADSDLVRMLTTRTPVWQPDVASTVALDVDAGLRAAATAGAVVDRPRSAQRPPAAPSGSTRRSPRRTTSRRRSGGKPSAAEALVASVLVGAALLGTSDSPWGQPVRDATTWLVGRFFEPTDDQEPVPPEQPSRPRRQAP